MALSFDFPVMVGATIACVPLAVSGRRLSRTEGAVLVVTYGIYVVTLAVKYHIADGSISSVWMR
jgi:Ca2+/Na+ antiporter